jgi:hypothetical protein
MTISFDIEPFVGALPIRFGLHRADVHRLLGEPEASHPIWNSSGTSDFWLRSSFNVGYGNDDIVNHIGFSPGGCELSLCGTLIWSLAKQPDPNPQLLQYDPMPVESYGILTYLTLGISTSGYHDGDEEQLSLTVSPIGTWDGLIKDVHRPDLSKYQYQQGQ